MLEAKAIWEHTCIAGGLLVFFVSFFGSTKNSTSKTGPCPNKQKRVLFPELFFQRRGWDSNPRALSDKRFSRPPRYDHFDTSPSIYLSAASVSPQRQDVFYHSFSLSSTPFSNFFYFFVFFLFSCIFHL